jgi:curli biogenesis system outer membrane secretion channel CsgG
LGSERGKIGKFARRRSGDSPFHAPDGRETMAELSQSPPQRKRQMRSAPLFIAALSLSASAAALHATPREPIATAILDFDYVDSSGESKDQTTEHARRLREFTDALGRDLAASGKFRIVPMTCGARPCSPRDAMADLQSAARAAGVRLVVFGGVHKMSTLVQWAKIKIADMERDRIVLDRLLTFRGDNDDAWRRAESFVAADIAALSPDAKGAEAQSKKIAVFDFELQDFSGGAGIIAESAEDSEQLRRATQAARKLIVESGRYALVDVASAEDQPVKAHELRQCDGCDASIAAKLGADLSLVGIVTRITRTDYAVTFRLRDARTGELISVGQTDLRIGANYSWDRGAAWLIEKRLLAKQGP